MMSSVHTHNDLNGVLLVDKPSGMTSHDVVHHIRKQWRIKKVGHGGTLDPMATGLLHILLGLGTKCSEEIMNGDKVYEGTMTLGVSTDTQDADGTLLEEKPYAAVSEEQMNVCMQEKQGDLLQVPPMVSAIKQNGVPMYKLARKGIKVDRKPRLLHIFAFELLAFELPEVQFRVKCTKGTYVRTLCADIGEALGCGAHLSALRRMQSGRFALSDAVTLEEALQGTRAELQQRVLSMDRVRALLRPVFS